MNKFESIKFMIYQTQMHFKTKYEELNFMNGY
jgi:hypothetical protein